MSADFSKLKDLVAKIDDRELRAEVAKALARIEIEVYGLGGQPIRTVPRKMPDIY